MRTIGDDKELVTGFLYGEGIIHELSDIDDIDVCEDEVLVSLSNTATLTLYSHPNQYSYIGNVVFVAE